MELIERGTILLALGEMTGWRYRDDVLTKTFERTSFRHAVELLNRICDAAEEQHRHLDLSLEDGTKVTATLSSPDAGGVTREDLIFAAVIEDLARKESRDHVH